MSKSPQTYKVLGHKKRADLAFHVSVSCEEAWARIRAFCRACGVSMVCVSDLQGVCLREEECEVGQYVYRFPGCEHMGDGSEVVKDMEEKGKDIEEKGKDMEEKGNRSLFFKVGEQLKSDVQRTNRRWRRLVAKQGME